MLRSRGEIVLEALDHADAADAEALTSLDGRSYRSFNLLIADNNDAFWLRSLGPSGNGHVDITEIPEGVSMLTSFDMNDKSLGGSHSLSHNSKPQALQTSMQDVGRNGRTF